MLNCRDGISSKKLALLIAIGGLAACSGEPIEQSSEAFSAMADVHNNPDVISSTAEIDQLLIDQDPTGNWMASVFDVDTVLLERGSLDETVNAEGDTPAPQGRTAFYGDLHVHTEYSFDGYAMGTQATPAAAVRFLADTALPALDLQIPA